MYYQSALRLRPGFTDALNNMAAAHLQKGAVAQVCVCVCGGGGTGALDEAGAWQWRGCWEVDPGNRA
jgi:hypothetical protein